MVNRKNKAPVFHSRRFASIRGLDSLSRFRLWRNRLALWEMSGQFVAHQGGLAELVDALDSKSSSNECGFESHSRYFLFTAIAGFYPTHAA